MNSYTSSMSTRCIRSRPCLTITTYTLIFSKIVHVYMSYIRRWVMWLRLVSCTSSTPMSSYTSSTPMSCTSSTSMSSYTSSTFNSPCSTNIHSQWRFGILIVVFAYLKTNCVIDEILFDQYHLAAWTPKNLESDYDYVKFFMKFNIFISTCYYCSKWDI